MSDGQSQPAQEESAFLGRWRIEEPGSIGSLRREFELLPNGAVNGGAPSEGGVKSAWSSSGGTLVIRLRARSAFGSRVSDQELRLLGQLGAGALSGAYTFTRKSAVADDPASAKTDEEHAGSFLCRRV